MAKTRDDIREEALASLRKHKRAGAGISMGVGKTRIGFAHLQLVIDRFGPDVTGLVVAPTKKIIKGWKEEAEKWDLLHLYEKLTFTTYLSLTKQSHDYDVIYLDECHSLIRDSHDPWLSKYTGYIIGLTGTPPKTRTSEKGRMVHKYCPIVYTYLVDEAVDDKILNDYKITVHLLSLDPGKNFRVEVKDKKGKVTKSWMTSEVENYKYWTDRVNGAPYGAVMQKLSILRMSAMKKYPSKVHYGKKLLQQADEKCILFANEQKQADHICKHSYHSKNKDSESNMQMFEDGIIDKLACVLQISEGANIRGLRMIILLHSYGNNRKAAQRIGRALRLSPEDTAHIHILCYKDTVDVKWVESALESFNQDKITWYDPDIF